MLIHPEVYAWMNRQSRPEREEKKPRPLVTKAEKINKGGPEKARAPQQYDPEERESASEVDYLNERDSKFSFYA